MKARTIRPQAAIASLALVASYATAQADAPPVPETLTPQWAEAEAPALTDHLQLTFPEQFSKAGEAYFSPTGRWIIFQAIPAPEEEGAEPGQFYSMYVARLRHGEDDAIVGIDAPILVSAPGSSNTCGYFHPTEPWRVIFGSTITPPAGDASGGYQRGTSRYRWAFPDEMEVVWRVVPDVFYDGRPREGLTTDWAEADTEARPLFSKPGYDAECAFSADGRNIVYSHVDPETQDSDLWVYDTLTRVHRPLVVAKGYDGGPFFSPDGAMICYRSDRRGDDLLQVYIGVLAYDDSGAVLGVRTERAVTDNQHVNWAPYWHPWQHFLIYATSEVGHDNYEVFATEVPVGILEKTAPAELKRRRITYAPGFDGLPVFSVDGKYMMWTSQRGPKHADEERPSSQIWVARVVDASPH